MADQPQGQASEVAPLFARPRLPGQHPEHSDRILAHLRRECGPRDFIEELWLADVAWLTARIDYFRAALAGLYDLQLRQKRRDHARANGEWFSAGKIEALAEIEQDDPMRADGTALAGEPVFQRLLGMTTLHELDTLGKLAVLEQLLGRERDRVLAQFERRRREQVKRVLDAVALELPASRS